MSEKMNVLMEKVYFRHILDNSEQITKVEPHYFKNEDIRFVYSIIREEYVVSKVKVVPSAKQIFAMVKMHSEVREMDANTLKLILKQDNSQYEDGWLEPRFKSWKLSNKLRDNITKSIEKVRNVDETDYDNVKEIVNQIKNISNEIDLIDDDDSDLGSDFDDPNVHRQDEVIHKINTGWSCLDTVLSGGWDYQSLNVIIGETNVGKCFSPNTLITVRNKNNNEIKRINIYDFFKSIEN